MARVTAGPDVRAERSRTRRCGRCTPTCPRRTAARTGKGWPFGRAVRAFDVSAVLARVPGVAEVEEVLLFPADPASGDRARTRVAHRHRRRARSSYSYQHQVRVQS